MKYTNADLTRWLQAANAALAENDLDCVVTSRDGSGEVRSPKGGIVTAWASGKVSAGGAQAAREEVMSVLSSAELLVGFRQGATGGMLFKMPETVATVPGPEKEIEKLRADSWCCDAPHNIQRIVPFLAEIHAVCKRHGLTLGSEGSGALTVYNFDFSHGNDDALLTALYR